MGTKDPKAHLQEFYAQCQDVQHNDNYLLRQFPRSLGGLALDWFMGLKKGTVSSFADLSKQFVKQFSFNLEKDIDTLDLLKEKQRDGETFAKYLQRWRAVISRMKSPPNEKEMVTLFLANAHLELAHDLNLHCVTTFT